MFNPLEKRERQRETERICQYVSGRERSTNRDTQREFGEGEGVRLDSLLELSVTIISCAGDAKFVSVTYRLFKLPKTIRDASHVTYKGGILGSEDKLDFDRATSFKVRVDHSNKQGIQIVQWQRQGVD